MTTFFFVLGALLILDIIVIAHELGHFLSARALGIPVLEFGVGMGPKVLNIRRGETEYSLCAFPIGGFCKYKGDDDGDFDDPGALNNQPPWKRFITVASGPLMNFVLAFVVSVLYVTLLGTPSKALPQIHEIIDGMPAQQAGLLPGDIVTSINGVPISYDTEGSVLLHQNISAAEPGKQIVLEVQRDGQPQTLTMMPTARTNDQGITTGVQIGIKMTTVRERQGIWQALGNSMAALKDTVVLMVDGLKNLVFKGEGAGDVMGPVGIVGFMQQEIRSGIDQIVNLLIIISLNLGIMNLLPLPALDGGRLVFIVIEAVTRKPIKPELEGWVHFGGLMVLFGLILAISFRDVVRLVHGG